MLTTLFNDGLISDRVYDELVAEVDAALNGDASSSSFDLPLESGLEDSASDVTQGG